VTELDILVDNEAARENILRFAASAKTAAEATAEADGEYRIRIRRDRELLIALGGG
jgi:TusA-related sulfurtransferase